jgi:hypothetical protein
VKGFSNVIFVVPPILPIEINIIYSRSSLIFITLILVNSLTKALVAALLLLPIFPRAFAAYICFVISPDFKILINSSMISIFGMPSLSKDSTTYKDISPFNNSLSKCFFISYIISPFFSLVHILASPSIRG